MRVRAAILALFLAAHPVAAGVSARRLARQARAAEKHGQFAQAYLLYSEAAAMTPGRRSYRLRAQALQSKAGRQTPAQLLASAGAPSDSPELSPEEVFDSYTAREFAMDRPLAEAPHLEVTPGRQPIHIQGDAKSLFAQAAKLYSLEVLFDSEYQGGQPLKFDLDEADYRDTLHGLEAATGSLVVPLGPRLMMVAKDTPAKRADLEQFITVTVPVPSALVTQELTEIANGLRGALDITKIAWDTQHNQIVIRDRVSKALAAQKLLYDLFRYRGQMIAEVRFFELHQTESMAIGTQLPSSFTAVYLGNLLRSAGASKIPSAITQLVTFGGGRTVFGIGVVQASVVARLDQSDSRLLLDTTLRSADGLPAKLHIGDKYPILTAGYFGPTSGSGNVYTPPPSYTFEDLGISLKLTPHLHEDQDVSLEVDTEFKVLTGGSANGIPVISNRQLTSTVRLKDDEWVLVAGLVAKTRSRQTKGIWGLSKIPLLGHLFKTYMADNDTDEVVIAIRPHVLSVAPPDTHAIRIGSEMRTITSL